MPTVKRNEMVTPKERQAFEDGYRKGYRDGLADGKSGKKKPLELMQLPVEALGLSSRPLNCLRLCGCKRISDVVVLSEEDIRQIRSLGKIGADEIARSLHEHKIYPTDWDEFLL